MQLLTLLICVWKIHLTESGNLVAVCGQPDSTTAVTYTPSGNGLLYSVVTEIAGRLNYIICVFVLAL